MKNLLKYVLQKGGSTFSPNALDFRSLTLQQFIKIIEDDLDPLLPSKPDLRLDADEYILPKYNDIHIYEMIFGTKLDKLDKFRTVEDGVFNFSDLNIMQEYFDENLNYYMDFKLTESKFLKVESLFASLYREYCYNNHDFIKLNSKLYTYEYSAFMVDFIEKLHDTITPSPNNALYYLKYFKDILEKLLLAKIFVLCAERLDKIYENKNMWDIKNDIYKDLAKSHYEIYCQSWYIDGFYKNLSKSQSAALKLWSTRFYQLSYINNLLEFNISTPSTIPSSSPSSWESILNDILSKIGSGIYDHSDNLKNIYKII